ncbi:MAG TPA: M23 family metallopeptidase, partial [Chroococcales cyanobacterium]
SLTIVLIVLVSSLSTFFKSVYAGERRGSQLLAARADGAVAANAVQNDQSSIARPAFTNAAGAPAGSAEPARTFAGNVRPLVDEQGNDVSPSAIAVVANDLFFLAPDCIWVCRDGVGKLAVRAPVVLHRLDPDKSVALQEFVNMVAYPPHQSLVVLDKSGDLFEYFPSRNKWQLFRANLPFLAGQPDPEFIDLTNSGSEIAVLDPERNNIWKTAGHKVQMTGSFRNILPWRVKKGDEYVGDAVSLADDGDIYVLRRTGWITRYKDTRGAVLSTQLPFHFQLLKGMRPTRLLTASGTPLYIVERENCRIVALDKATGKPSQFIFPASADLRGLAPLKDGFWAINGSTLVYRNLGRPDSLKLRCHTRSLDSRFDGLRIPLAGISLPHHPGVYPGARRLYRFGVHAGLDFFDPGGKKMRVTIGTPVKAADTGRVLRADGNFKSMTQAQLNHIMSECFKQHRTSEHNEDLFRGCQVWIDHGNGLVTRYCHLTKIFPKIKKGDFVNG